jgi:arginase
MKAASSTTRRITLIGAPTDIGAGVRGASMGPEALRVAGIRQRIEALAVDVSDAGDLHGPRNPDVPAVDGHRHLVEVAVWNGLVRDAVADALRGDRMPVLLGGDHCLAIGSIDAVARHCRERGRKLRILWLDAHADFNTAALTPTGNLHGMPLACLCGLGPEALTGGHGHPAIRAEWVRQIGVRSVDDGERRLLKEHGIEVFDMRTIDEVGMRRTMERALAGIDDDTHVHVSFDVDFLDPSVAPGVGTTVGGGPTYREARLCMEMIADTGRLGSLDIMELNPALDVRNGTAEVVVDLVGALFGRSLLTPTLDANAAAPLDASFDRVLKSLTSID